MSTTATDRLSAVLHDGTRIQVTKVGSGPYLLLPVRTDPYDDATAATMRAWGGDPDLGLTLMNGLAEMCTVVAADYEGHRLSHPAPSTLTASNVAADLLAIADAAGAETFACYGYSWLALAALQLAVRTDRLVGLVMGGFPPLDGPYAAMLTVTRAAHAAALRQTLEPSKPAKDSTPGDWDAAGIQADPDQTAQFVTLYEDLQSFDDSAKQPTIPRLCFVGELDNIDYGPQWGDTRVVIADAVRDHHDQLLSQGWTVKILPGLDHLGAMRGETVLPLLREWLTAGWLTGAAPSHRKARA